MKLIIKLAVAALVANAAWRVGSAYMAHYKFKDAVSQEAQFSADKTPDALRQRVLQLAQQYDVPVASGDFTVDKAMHRTRIAGSYTTTIEIVPGYKRPWPFTWEVETVNFSNIAPLTPK